MRVLLSPYILLAFSCASLMAAGFALGRGAFAWSLGCFVVAAWTIAPLYRSVLKPFMAARAVASKAGMELDLPAGLEGLSQELAASRDLHKHLDEVIDTMAGALILADTDRRIVRVNAAARNLTGFEDHELVGGSLDRVFPEKKPINTGSLVQLSAAGRMRNVEKLFRHRDGSDIPVLFSGSALHGDDGRPRQYVCVAYDIRQRKEYESRLQKSLHEKELLLREVHHRVKNNLQVISSLLDLQSEHLKDSRDRELIRDSRNRIRSMALIHEQLYRHEDLSDVKLGPYLENIAGHLFRSYGVEPGRVILRCRLEEIAVDLDRAVACGLIVNELVSNALEHAFPNGESGEIRIELGRSRESLEAGPSMIELCVLDDGRGFEIDADRSQSMGLELVTMMGQQLRGRVEMTSRGNGGDRGSRFLIVLPEAPPSEGLPSDPPLSDSPAPSTKEAVQ